MNDTFDGPMDRNDPELLISRIVDGEATPGDWSAFRLQADRDQALWRALAEAQRTQSELSDEVSAAVAVAGRIDVPVHTEMVRRLSDRIRIVGMWGGWLAAACVALMWARGPRQEGSLGTPTQANLTPVQMLQSYLDKGQEQGKVLGEMPEKVLVRAVPVTDSGGTNIDGYKII